MAPKTLERKPSHCRTQAHYSLAVSQDIGVQGTKGIEGYSKAKLKYMIYDHYQKIWEFKLNLNPKAIFYHSLKVDIKFKPYLNTIRDRSLRVMLSKFRLSDRELNIETGRHCNIKRDKRYCPFCNDNSIDYEYHILFQCSKYFVERNTLFLKIGHILHAEKHNNNENQQIIFSSNDPAVNLYVATYIKKCVEIRYLYTKFTW